MFWNACIDHGRFKTTKSVTLCLLCFLKFLKQFSFHTLQLLSLALVVRDLLFKFSSLVVDIGTRICNFLSNELVLTRYSYMPLLFNFGLSFLCLHEVFLTLSIKALLHHIFLLTHLLNNGQFRFHSIITSVADLGVLLRSSLLS